MQSGNGIDLAAVHQLLTEVAQTVRGHSERFERIEARLDSHTEKLNELVAAANQHSREMDDLSASLGELRLGVQQYHSAVIGPWDRADWARRARQADRGPPPPRPDTGLRMADKPQNQLDEAYRRMLALYNSIPPGPDHTERFLEKIHGSGWKERAMAAGPMTLEYGRRLSELEVRVSRIERHLNPPSNLLDWPKPELIEPLKPEPQDE